MTEIWCKMKDCNNIVTLTKKVSIYNAVINTKDAWKQLPTDTVVKCFRKAGIHHNMFDGKNEGDDDNTPVVAAEPDQFDQWFADFLEVPWEEYLV